MKHNSSHVPFVKLPTSTDLILYLIREELKGQKFFNDLAKLGLGHCFYQPYLGKVILAQLKMDVESDEVNSFYCKLIEKRSKKIGDDQESVMKQAMKVYVALMGKRELN